MLKPSISFTCPRGIRTLGLRGSPHEYYTRSDAEEAIRAAEEVLRWVEGVWRSLRKEGA